MLWFKKTIPYPKWPFLNQNIETIPEHILNFNEHLCGDHSVSYIKITHSIKLCCRARTALKFRLWDYTSLYIRYVCNICYENINIYRKSSIYFTLVASISLLLKTLTLDGSLVKTTKDQDILKWHWSQKKIHSSVHANCTVKKQWNIRKKNKIYKLIFICLFLAPSWNDHSDSGSRRCYCVTSISVELKVW